MIPTGKYPLQDHLAAILEAILEAPIGEPLEPLIKAYRVAVFYCFEEVMAYTTDHRRMAALLTDFAENLRDHPDFISLANVIGDTLE